MSFGYQATTTVGRIQAGEVDTLFTPRSPRRGTCGVVLLHGSGNPQAFIDLTSQPASVKLAAALATAGIPCIAGDMGGQTWGNDTIQSRIDSAWAVLKAAFPAMRTDKFCLVAGSMGGAGAARYTQTHPERVAAFLGLIPLLDVVAFYNANVGGSQVEVGAAWGVTAPAPLPAAADIAANAVKARSVPFLAGYSTADTTVLPQWVTAYAAAVGGATLVTDTTVGHSDAAVAGMPLDVAGRFLASHGA